jgi:hypothetical protein
MTTTKVEKNFKEYLESIKVYGRPILGPLEIEYLCSGIETGAYEFKQEAGETDEEFYENFVKWLHESRVTTGFVDYFLFLGLRRHERLTPWAFKNLESKVTECFEKSNGWLYEINHRVRFRLTIRLVISKQPGLCKLTRRSTEDQGWFYRTREKELGHFVDPKKTCYNTLDLYA